MKPRTIIGIDFTSAPTARKPIVCAQGTLCLQLESLHQLVIHEITSWRSFDHFELFLSSNGHYHAGFDFPFGMPQDFVREMGWPREWDAYVEKIAGFTKQDFCNQLEAYSKSAPAGKKHLYRESDRLASACSPMMLYGVPVAKMFFEGATRLQQSDLSILPCRATQSRRTAIEAYPALVVRHLVGRTKYKAGSARQDDSQRIDARQKIIRLLQGPAITAMYGITVNVATQLQQQAVQDSTGDTLDAICCCIQVAWSATHPTAGIPTGVATNEGWIVDPTVLQNRSF